GRQRSRGRGRGGTGLRRPFALNAIIVCFSYDEKSHLRHLSAGEPALGAWGGSRIVSPGRERGAPCIYHLRSGGCTRPIGDGQVDRGEHSDHGIRPWADGGGRRDPRLVPRFGRVAPSAAARCPPPGQTCLRRRSPTPIPCCFTQRGAAGWDVGPPRCSTPL